jgi:hypothetical protein
LQLSEGKHCFGLLEIYRTIYIFIVFFSQDFFTIPAGYRSDSSVTSGIGLTLMPKCRCRTEAFTNGEMLMSE